MLTANDIVETLGAVGIVRGDRLLVHSSLRAIGPVDGGGDGLIDALLKTVGSEGTIMIPTFNYAVPEPYFDVASTPSRTGMLGELLRQRPNAARSLHPTHSIVVIGQNAAELAEDHLYGACALGSPVDKIARDGGKVLLLGVSHTSNTTIHVAEVQSGIHKPAAWDGAAPTARVRDRAGTIHETTLDTSNSCSFAFNAVDLPMRQRHMIRDMSFGQAVSCTMKAQDLIDTTVSLVTESPTILACTRAECVRCQRQREYYAEP